MIWVVSIAFSIPASVLQRNLPVNLIVFQGFCAVNLEFMEEHKLRNRQFSIQLTIGIASTFVEDSLSHSVLSLFTS